MDRLSTIDKYVLGTRLVLGKTLFDRNREPTPSLIILFKHRNDLVHPKPGYGPPGFHKRETKETYTPADAARFTVAVARAAVLLGGSEGVGQVDVPASKIWQEEKKVRVWQTREPQRA